MAKPESAPLPAPAGSDDAPAPLRAAATATPTSDDLGGFDDWAQADLQVDLDMGSVPPPAKAAAPAADRPGGATSGSASVGASHPMGRPGSKSGPMPMGAQGPMAGVVAGQEAEGITADEVEAVAQYGPPPANIFSTPMYAYRVYRRKKALQEGFALREEAQEAGIRGLRRQRKEVFETVARRHPQSVQALQQGLDQADAAVVQQQQHFSSQNEAVSAQLQSIEKQRRSLDEQLRQLRRDHQMAQVAAEEAQRRYQQLQTDLARYDDRIARAQGGGASVRAPGGRPVDVATLQREKAQLATQLPGRGQALNQAQLVERTRRQELQQLERQLQGLDRQLSQAETTAKQTHAASFRALNAAQDQRLGAYEDALASVVEQAPQLLEPPEKQKLEEIDAGIVDLEKNLELHRRALTAYDDNAYRQGVGLVVVAAIVLFLFVASLVRVG